jgi:hypothetical protein
VGESHLIKTSGVGCATSDRLSLSDRLKPNEAIPKVKVNVVK